MATHSSMLGKCHGQRAWQATVHGVPKVSDRTEHTRMHVWGLKQVT